MDVDFGKVFGKALRYPLKPDVYFLFFIVQLAFNLAFLAIFSYFIGDLTAQTAPSVILGKLFTSSLYMSPLIIINFLITTFLAALYYENAFYFYKGHRQPLLKSIPIAKKRFLPLLATVILIILILVLCFGSVLVLIPLALISPSILANPFIIIPLLLWLIVGLIIGIVIGFFIMLSPIVCVLDNVGPIESIKKSFGVIGKNKLNTLLFLIIFVVIYMVISLIGSLPQTINGLLSGFSGQAPQLFSIQDIPFTMFTLIFSVYLILFTFSSMVSYYLNISRE